MNSVRTIVVTSFIALALSFATAPANAANRLVNGDFETCDLTGWSWAPSEPSQGFPLTGVYNGIGIDGCSFVVLDQGKIEQVFEVVDGEAFDVSFDADLVPIVSDITSLALINEPCEAEDPVFIANGGEITFGRVTVEWLKAIAPGFPSQTLGGVVFDFDTGGSHGGPTGIAPTGTTHARVTVSGCAALGGAIFDNIVVDTAA